MPTRNLGPVSAIDAESFGEPGHRTFRMVARGHDGEAGSLWMEKEQFQALSLAMKQLLEQLGKGDTEGAPLPEAFASPERPDIEFKVGRLGMGFAEEDQSVVLYLYEIEQAEDEDAALALQMTLDQCASLAHRLDVIIAAGRPVCFLCGMSIDPGGHVCARANGHRKEGIPPGEDEE